MFFNIFLPNNLQLTTKHEEGSEARNWKYPAAYLHAT